MARVDFYVLSQPGEQARQLFACRLAEKAYRLDNSVYILTRDQATAEKIDELLWTFRDGSFVPHHLARPGAAELPSPVCVGYDADAAGTRDLLISLFDDIPPCAGAFPRIAELVTSDAESKQHSRRRFATYRDQGHELDTHNV
jgi:DNA polymerase-3 subunit chi